MERFQKPSSLIAITLLLAGIISTLAFTHRSINKKPRTDWTDYYWFNSSGTYLRQNIVDDEIQLTGYDEFQYAPYTVRERGYTPAGVIGDPPVPILPFLPAKRLYSHP
ncbi:hypothetical protein A3860_38230 [Niastella vici]|uniref:Uncharacterized protein n=1 Tax=Niastella vici TaxID=1703345 RepID=A0A1V9FLJ6_9BACT|nr:hypothetical protein [Niastella vici]OQP59222.1 hypothetical protein A3860_38230 [Niastella vici]